MERQSENNNKVIDLPSGSWNIVISRSCTSLLPLQVKLNSSDRFLVTKLSKHKTPAVVIKKACRLGNAANWAL
jgi:hypothetical protein